MRWIAALAFVLASPLAAEEVVAMDVEPLIQPAGDATLDAYLWHKRPVIVFAESEEDLQFVRQMQLLNEELDELRDRDVVVLTDTDPETLSPLREKLRPRGFMLVLVGKDGGVKLRKPLPYSVRELSRTIDKMPMRQQEIRDRRAAREGT